MKLSHLFVVGSLFFGLSGKVYAAPLAILTGVKGTVQVVQKGKTSAGKNGVALEAGDVVRVGAGSIATVYYATRAPQILLANQQVKVAAPGAATKPSVWSNVYKGVASGFARRGEKVGATVRADKTNFAKDAVVLLSPVNSRVLRLPKLSWILRDAPGDFQVTLSDAQGNDLWQISTPQLSLELPAQPPLTAGKKYFWSVTPRARDAAGKLTPIAEKASGKAWFEIASPTQINAAQAEQRAITSAFPKGNDSNLRVAQASALAAALAERGFYDEAIGILSKRSLQTAFAKGNGSTLVLNALKQYDAAIAKMDDAARWQLRRLYIDTKQIELAQRIEADAVGIMRGADEGSASSISSAADALQKPLNYADPDKTFLLSFPAGWKAKRSKWTEDTWLTEFTTADPKGPRITLFVRRPLADLKPESLEEWGPDWIEEINAEFRKLATVRTGEVQKVKFLGLNALRVGLDLDSPQSGPVRGFVNVVFGKDNAFLVAYSAPVDKPLELTKIEAILNSLIIEPVDKADNSLNGQLSANLEAIRDLPPARRDTLAKSNALIAITYEILNPPIVGKTENGNLLSETKLRDTFEQQKAQLATIPADTLEFWRAARDLAQLCLHLNWRAAEAKKNGEAEKWFLLANDYKKYSYEAARNYYTTEFFFGQKQIFLLEKIAPVESQFSGARDWLESLYGLQGMRAGALDNLARMQSDYPAILKWGQAQVDIHRQAQKYTQYDYKDYDLTKPENAWARKAVIQLPISIANGLESVAEAQSNLGQFEDAEKSLQQALELRRSVPEDYVLRYTDMPLRQLGSLYRTLGDYRRAVDFYEQAFQVVEASMPARKVLMDEEKNEVLRQFRQAEYTQTRVTILNNLSITQSKLGDYRKAENYLKQAISELEVLPDLPYAKPVVLWQKAVTLGNRGVLLIDSGEIEKGMADLHESIKLWREQGYADRAGNALLNAAAVYDEQGRKPEYQDAIMQAQQLFTLSQDVTGLFWSQQLAARQARESGQFDESAKIAQEELRMARQIGSIDYIATATRNLGAARLKQKQFAEATKLLDEALKLDEQSGTTSSIALDLFWQGELLVQQNRANEALTKYKRAIELIEKIRATVNSANNYGEDRYIYQVYESIVSLLIKMGRPAEAFDYLGRSKSKKLQDSLRLTNLRSGDATLQAQLDRAAALQLRLEALNQALSTERSFAAKQQSATKIASLQQRAQAAQNELDDIAAQIKKTRTGLGATLAAVTDNNSTSLGNVQKQIPPDAALVQWAPVGTNLYAFIVTRDAVEVQLLPAPASDIENGVRTFRRLMDDARARATRGEKITIDNWLSDEPATKSLRENLMALRQMLIAPIEAKIAAKNTIVFVPNGALYYLPLHALVKRDGNTLKFFGQEKRIAYLAAADVLSVLQKTPARGTGLLALGDPTGAALPAAGEEAKALSNIFPAAQIYTGAQATKNNVVAPQNENRRIWHLATHGVLNPTHPELSYILLAPGNKPGDEELTVGEVYGLDLKNTDLVTLSACQTAIGEKNPDGLEITSLATSFARAGADSVIASLWNVADDSTRDFMVEFYKNLAAGQSKSAAMQAAQSKLLADARYNHPFYWAPFILMGDWR